MWHPDTVADVLFWGCAACNAASHRPPSACAHQDGNYPLHSGGVSEVGKGAGEGFTLNVPLPPGCGGGAYRAAFDRVVGPALDAFRPELILVSAGYDASYLDPLAAMMLSAADFRCATCGMRTDVQQQPKQQPQDSKGLATFYHAGGKERKGSWPVFS